MKYIKNLFVDEGKKENGFTIIELLVVFSLMAFITSLGIVSFVSYSRAQSITQSVNQAKLIIQEAKFNALSSVKPSKTPDGTIIDCSVGTLTGYQVAVVLATGELKLFLLCSSSAQPIFLKTVKLADNITFESILTTCTIINFDSLTSQASGSPLPCDLVIKGYNMQKKLTIDLGGNITVQ